MNPIHFKTGKVSSSFLKATAGIVSSATEEYFKEAMPVVYSLAHDSKSTASELKTVFKNTAQSVFPTVKQLKSQGGFRNIMRWYTQQADEFDNFDGPSNYDDPEIDEEGMSQITELEKGSNQISKAVVESTGKLAESQLEATANIISKIDQQTSVISAGFKRTNTLLENMLEVMTKNTATMIETMAVGFSANKQEKSANDNMLSKGKFNLSDYKKIIKGNFDQSELGVAASMLPMLMEIAKDPKQAVGGLLTWGVNKMAPGINKSMKALDEIVNETIMDSLIRLGENRNSAGLRGFIGQLFGIDSRRKSGDTSRPDLELKSVSFDTITRESIVNAIPGYLRKILVAVGGPDEVYDYRSRSFKTRAAIKKEFHDAAASSGTLRQASPKVRSSIGNDDFSNMLYDLVITDLGSKTGNGQSREILNKLQDKRFAGQYMRELVRQYDLNNEQLKGVNTFARNLSNATRGTGARDISNQIARTNVNRHHRVNSYINEANMYEVDLSDIDDNVDADLDAIAASVGLSRKRKKSRGSSASTGSIKVNNLQGINYTNMALYEIYRRLNAGINVFQVGRKDIYTDKFKPLGDDYLSRPMGYKPRSMSSSVNGDNNAHTQISMPTAIENGPNELMNQELEDGTTENLSKGQRFLRWSKSRGKALGSAIVSGKTSDVKAIFKGMMMDVAGVAADSAKKGMSNINSSFGNISGYLQHKMFGNEYSYQTGVDEQGNPIFKKIAKNEKGGIFGFVKDNVSDMFKEKKDAAKDWFKEVIGFFDYSGDDPEEKQIEGKRKKILAASVGGMAGLGILGGPMGLLAGAIAGNALSGTGIWKKMKEKLFGRDDETGKAKGLFTKAIDGIIDPIHYQVSKTMKTAASALKNNILAPLGDIGRAIRDRAVHGAKHYFKKFFEKVFDTKLVKGVRKVVSTVIGTPLKLLGRGVKNLGGKIGGGLLALPGVLARGAITGGSRFIGGGLSGIAQHIAAGTDYGLDEFGNRINGRQLFKDRREEQVAKNKRENEYNGLGSYKDWKKDRNKRRVEGRKKFKGYTAEDVSIVTAESTDEMARTTQEISRGVDQITGEIIPGSSFKTHDQGLHERLDELLRQMKRGSTDSIISGSIGLIGTGDEVSNDEEKLITAMAEESSKENANKSTIVSKFKNLLGINKKKSAAETEKKTSLFSSIVDGIGDIMSKGWPIILGGLMMLSSGFRETIGNAVTSAGKWLLEKLPGIIGGALSIGKEVVEGANRGIENLASGATSVKDEVTGEMKSVLSAEKHSEKIQNGIFSSAVDSTMNVARLFKDMMLQSGGRTAIRALATVPQIGGGLLAGSSAIANFGVKTAQRVGSGATSIIGAVRSGSGVWNAIKEGGKALTSPFNSGSSMLDDVTKAGVNVAKGATNAKSLVSGFKKAFTSPVNLGSIAGGVIADISSSIAWDATEYAKNAHIVGDYGFGNAGGFRMTSTTVKGVTTTAAGIAGGIALGATIKAVMAGAATAVAGGPVGWIVGCVAGIIALSAAIASLVNLAAGLVTDKLDEDYAIRSNSSKLHAVIGETFTYVDGAENPMYVYAGRESDRVLGITKGMNMRDPEIVFGRFIKKLAEGLTSAPGSEMLLYDFINNMAVQGVPFACYVAGDSNKSKTGGSHANSGIITEFEDTDKVGLVGFGRIEYTQVKKSTVMKNKDKVFADIAANISRQDTSIVWNEDDLVDLYNTCKDVVDQLKSEGIIKSSGKVNTSIFKGSPNSGKNDGGWKSLDKLCRKNGAYFLTQSIAYINSKIECDKSGQQWMQYRIEDIKKLTEGLSDVFEAESEAKIKEMKEAGMSDSEIKAVMEGVSTDPSGEMAEGSVLTSDDYSPSLSFGNTGIKTSDQEDITKEMRYLVAAYAYSHPEILQKWVQSHSEESEVSVDNQDKISDWKNAFSDKRKKAILWNQMATAALKFADDQGDIFDILPKVNWDEVYNSYTEGVKSPGDEYGAGFIVRGTESKPGEGKLGKLWDQGKVGEDNTPEDIHKILFGNKSHGKGSESANAKDIGWGNTGIIGLIGENIANYASAEGLKLFDPNNSIADSREVAVNISSPSKLGVGGPVDPLGEDGIDTSPNASTITSGGNPISEPYKITSPFGMRSDPYPGEHKGVDLVPKSGNTKDVEVGSRFDGTVVQVKSDVADTDHAFTGSNGKFTYPGNNDTGNMVTIKTDDGLVIRNMHLAAGSIPKNIHEGVRVKAGDKIGIMGNTGWSTGPHLHYQIEKNGVPIDPESTLSQGSTVSSFNQDGSSTYPVADSPYQSDGSYDYSGISGATSGSTTSGSGPLGEFISKLKEIGNNFLSGITGGLLGSSTSSDTSGSTYGLSNYSGSTFGSFGNYNLSTTSNSEWVNVVRTVKEAVAAQQPEYNQSGYITINVGGKSIKTRTDCTGIICAMLKLYGVVSDSYSNYSDGFLRDGAIPDGFDKAPWPGWDALIEGDILVRSGHAEVFARNEGSSHLVYNGGSTNALRSPGATYTAHKDGYTVIWRCREAAGSSTDSIVEAAMNLGNSAVAAINPGAAGIANVAMAASNSIGSSKYNDPQNIWNFLKMQGYTDESASGIMGCWEAEGNNTPFRIEGDYLKGYPGYETVMQSNESLDDYTTNFLFPKYKIGIKKEAYKGEDGHYYPGIGFAQWTGPRAYNLIQFAKERGLDWRDGATQLQFFNQEMEQRKLSPELNAQGDSDSATSVFAKKYEVVSNSDKIKERQSYAKLMLSKYRNSNTTDDTYLATDGGGMGGAEIDDQSSISKMEVIPNISKKTSSRSTSVSSTPRIVNTSTTSVAKNIPISTSGPSTPQRDDINPEEILKTLYLVLDELRNITGNTGDSNSLLASLNEKDFVDQGLRDSLNSLGKSTRTNSRRSYYSSNSSVKTISSMARP